MKRSFLYVSIILASLLVIPSVYAQFKEIGPEIGIYGGAAMGQNESEKQPFKFFGRLSFGMPLLNHLQGELGVGLGSIEGDEYKTELLPLDIRLRYSPVSSTQIFPYVLVGAEALQYHVKRAPTNVTTNFNWLKRYDVAFAVPVGAGIQIRLSQRVYLDFQGAEHFTFTDNLNPVPTNNDEQNDYYLTLLGGIKYAFGPCDNDRDHDGLTNKEEKGLKTNPNNKDTDGDGLNDGDEVLKYKTNPLKADTDGDGLSDSEEVMKDKTDALKADTDGDGLNDGAEVLQYKTDPLKTDTDADGLNDGQEINTNKTNALKADTDGGTVNDGTEVNRGTNPLDPSDDIPKVTPAPTPTQPKVEKGAKIVLEGVVFKTGSSLILAESEGPLNKTLQTLKDNPEISIEIQGYTDNTGKLVSNQKLSQARAESVMKWLVNHGIAQERLTAKGFGPDNPIAPNDTPEGRAKNRRIEFVRTM